MTTLVLIVSCVTVVANCTAIVALFVTRRSLRQLAAGLKEQGRLLERLRELVRPVRGSAMRLRDVHRPLRTPPKAVLTLVRLERVYHGIKEARGVVAAASSSPSPHGAFDAGDVSPGPRVTCRRLLTIWRKGTVGPRRCPAAHLVALLALILPVGLACGGSPHGPYQRPVQASSSPGLPYVGATPIAALPTPEAPAVDIPEPTCPDGTPGFAGSCDASQLGTYPQQP